MFPRKRRPPPVQNNDLNQLSPYNIKTKSNGQLMRINIILIGKKVRNQFQTYHFFKHLGETFLVNLREDIKRVK